MPDSKPQSASINPAAKYRLNMMANSWKELELFHAVLSVAKMLEREVFVVGGVLRDCILGRETRDYDLAVFEDALPFAQLLAEAVRGVYVPLDEIHGSARVVLRSGDSVDLTDFRRPTFAQDCQARDFTCNGLSASLVDFLEKGAEAIIDPCNGVGDIENRLIRMIRKDNFSEDPLRVLRLFRYAAVLDFEIEPDTFSAAAENAFKITDVSSERILSELQQIFGSKRFRKVIVPMEESGMFQALFPFKTPDEITQWVKDAARIESLVYQDPPFSGLDLAMTDSAGFLTTIFLAALKPGDHPSDLVATLRLSNKMMGRILKVGMCLISTHRMVFENIDPEDFIESVARSALLLKNDRPAPWLILMAQTSDSKVLKVFQKAENLFVETISPIINAPPLITGGELIETSGKEPGPWVAEALEALFFNRLHGKITDKSSALQFIKRYLKTLDVD